MKIVFTELMYYSQGTIKMCLPPYQETELLVGIPATPEGQREASLHVLSYVANHLTSNWTRFPNRDYTPMYANDVFSKLGPKFFNRVEIHVTHNSRVDMTAERDDCVGLYEIRLEPGDANQEWLFGFPLENNNVGEAIPAVHPENPDIPYTDEQIREQIRELNGSTTEHGYTDAQLRYLRKQQLAMPRPFNLSEISGGETAYDIVSCLDYLQDMAIAYQSGGDVELTDTQKLALYWFSEVGMNHQEKLAKISNPNNLNTRVELKGVYLLTQAMIHHGSRAVLRDEIHDLNERQMALYSEEAWHCLQIDMLQLAIRSLWTEIGGLGKGPTDVHLLLQTMDAGSNLFGKKRLNPPIFT